jgi:hypothetical protein
VTWGTPPPDPAYQPFLAGLRAVAADPVGQTNERWHPPKSNWYSYDPAEWGMEDVRAAPTPPGTALQRWGIPPGTLSVNEFTVAHLFTELQSASTRLNTWHPGANFVWSPFGGTWEVAFKRAASPPPPPPPGNTSTGDLPVVAVEKIAVVERMGRLGEITHAVEQAEIQRILNEYR